MTLHKQITQKLEQVSYDDVLRAMGYHSLKVGHKTLQKFLDTDTIHLWLKTGNFDMKYGSEAFLRKLIELLDLSGGKLEEEIKKFKVRQDQLSAMQNPYIYIDTHFKRNSEPIFALAMMESRRRIKIDKDWIVDMDIEEVLEGIEKMLREHYETHAGKLPLWGRIYNYIYHHADGSRYIFDTKGHLKKDAEEISESKAELKIGSKVMTNLIGGE